MSSPSPTFKRGCCPPCALKPDWSPVPADPRFSRNTPDQVLAHVVLNSTSRVIGDSELWAVQLLHARARTTPLQGPKRSKMIDLMKKIANVPEPCWDSRAHVPSSIISRRSRTLSSPKRQKTVELHSRHRSVMS